MNYAKIVPNSFMSGNQILQKIVCFLIYSHRHHSFLPSGFLSNFKSFTIDQSYLVNIIDFGGGRSTKIQYRPYWTLMPEEETQSISSNMVDEHSSSTGSSIKYPTTPSNEPAVIDNMMDDWEKELEASADVVLLHEVDSYLIDRLEPNDKKVKFDILNWWKNKGKITYPTLALVAKDMLAIQVSTVANESAFGTGEGY